MMSRSNMAQADDVARRPQGRRIALFRRWFAFGVLTLLSMGGCRLESEASYLPDETWLQIGRETPVGKEFVPQEEGAGTSRRLRELGFVRKAPFLWQRQVLLDAVAKAAPLMDPLTREVSQTNIDSVAILSIDRNNGDEPYLYDTLQSLLSELPEAATVNVFVGDDRLDYVSSKVLTTKIGERWAKQVRIVPTEPAIAQHFREQAFTVSERASWNYSRVLRAYAGHKHYLVIEDDIVWGRAALAHLDNLLRDAATGATTAYNWRCDKLPGGSGDPNAEPRLLSLPLPWYHHQFSGTQAMAFPAKHANEIGNHLLLRAGRTPYDFTIDEYLRSRNLHIGVAQPSMVQHTGVKTTGLGYHHTSACFLPIFPALPLADGNAR